MNCGDEVIHQAFPAWLPYSLRGVSMCVHKYCVYKLLCDVKVSHLIWLSTQCNSLAWHRQSIASSAVNTVSCSHLICWSITSLWHVLSWVVHATFSFLTCNRKLTTDCVTDPDQLRPRPSSESFPIWDGYWQTKARVLRSTQPRD